MRRLEREYTGYVTFTWVNILLPDSTDLIDRYGFSATPEIYLVDGQDIVLAFWDEPPDPAEFRQVLESLISP